MQFNAFNLLIQFYKKKNIKINLYTYHNKSLNILSKTKH